MRKATATTGQFNRINSQDKVKRKEGSASINTDTFRCESGGASLSSVVVANNGRKHQQQRGHGHGHLDSGVLPHRSSPSFFARSLWRELRLLWRLGGAGVKRTSAVAAANVAVAAGVAHWCKGSNSLGRKRGELAKKCVESSLPSVP